MIHDYIHQCCWTKIFTTKKFPILSMIPKNHMRRIPMKNSMSSGCIVISENRKKQGIKMHPQKRTNQDSTKSYEFYKHMRTYKSKDSLKNFYLDDFNSVKENKFNKTKTNVRKIYFNQILFNYREDIYLHLKIML